MLVSIFIGLAIAVATMAVIATCFVSYIAFTHAEVEDDDISVILTEEI